jgi:hypothetical protein
VRSQIAALQTEPRRIEMVSMSDDREIDPDKSDTAKRFVLMPGGK